MGKALVINGLEVNNPLTTVTFLDEGSVLDAYLAANTSISAAEESALQVFVDGLLENNLFTKMRYFYPMLGDNVSDMLLDVITPSTEDLMANLSSRTELSVSDRKLNVGNASGIATDVNLLTRFKTTDWHNLGILTSTYHGSLNSVITFWFSGQTGNYSFRTNPLSDAFTYRPPRINVGYDGAASVNIPTAQSTDERTYLDRIIFAQVNGSDAKLYKENNLYASGASYVGDIEYLNNVLILGGKTTTYKFFAITDPLTAEEYATLYGLLLAFLQAVGKHS